MNHKTWAVLLAAFLIGTSMIWIRRETAAQAPKETPKDPVVLASLEDLLEQRRDCLSEALEGSRAVFRAGHGSIDRVLRLNTEILEAELEVADAPGVRKKAYVAHLRLAREFENFTALNLNNGTGTRQAMFDAKAHRLLAEINIARLADKQ